MAFLQCASLLLVVIGMTEAELDLLEMLWKRKVKIKRIAEVMGYPATTISVEVCKDRERFPLRNQKVNEEVMAVKVMDIIEGRTDALAVSKELGLNIETVRRRVRNKRQKMRREKMKRDAEA